MMLRLGLEEGLFRLFVVASCRLSDAVIPGEAVIVQTLTLDRLQKEINCLLLGLDVR